MVTMTKESVYDDYKRQLVWLKKEISKLPEPSEGIAIPHNFAQIARIALFLEEDSTQIHEIEREKQEGNIMEKEKTVRLMLLLPESMKKASQEEAEKMGISMTAWVRLAIMDKLKESKK